MIDRHIEIRADGMYTVQEVYDKPIVQQVVRGWHVLFLDGAAGSKRFGYVHKIDLELREFLVFDVVVYPNAPSPLDAQGELVSFEAVVIAQQGFNWLHDRDVYEGGRKIGKRRIATIIQGSESDADVGWFARRGKAGCVYVDRQGDRWQLRL
jgi:hypothetical protein